MVRFDPGVPRKYLFGHLMWFGCWLFITAVGIYLRPDPAGHGTHMQLGLPPCPSTLMFDRPCPGCGLTTSFTATLHGDFVRAFEAHQLGSLLYLLLTASALACGYGFLKGMRFNTDSRKFNIALACLVVVFFTFGAVRFATSKNYNDKLPEPLARRQGLR